MSFVGLYTGLTGIRAAQTGIDITGHNVANAATPGYTRQRVELAARPVYQSPAGPVGTGVDVQSIGRLRDGFLDARFRSAAADHAGASVHADVLAQVESLSGEPDQGISSRLARLWEAAESWANAPGDPAARRQVLSELASVTDTIRTTAASWQQLADDVTDRHKTQVDVANDTLESLRTLDLRLAGTEPQRVGPDLMDQRDLLLDDVARLTGATVGVDEGGRAYARIGGHDLLRDGRLGELVHEGGPPASLTLQPAPAADGSQPDDVTDAQLGGELGGLRTALADIARLGEELDGFAESFALAVNAVNVDAGGVPLLDTTGAPLAANIRPVDGLRPEDLVAGSGGPHDNTNARVFADLRTTKVDADGVQANDGSTIENRLSDLIVGLAGDVRAAKSTANGARAVAAGAELARVSEHGVSIDEEMVSLVRYQRSLEAASRVMTTVDEALEVLVNRTGIVGR